MTRIQNTKEASSSRMLQKKSHFPVFYGCFFLGSCSVEVQIDARKEAVEKATQASSATSSGFYFDYFGCRSRRIGNLEA